MEIDNFLEKELRIMIVNMIQDLKKTMEKMQEMFIKYLEELKNKEIEMNNMLEGINNRITEAGERINGLEIRMVEVTATEQNIEKRMKIKMKTAKQTSESESESSSVVPDSSQSHRLYSP